jgi:hypothetical protein
MSLVLRSPFFSPRSSHFLDPRSHRHRARAQSRHQSAQSSDAPRDHHLLERYLSLSALFSILAFHILNFLFINKLFII